MLCIVLSADVVVSVVIAVVVDDVVLLLMTVRPFRQSLIVI